MIKVTCDRRETGRAPRCDKKAVVLFMSPDDTDWSASDWLVEAACEKCGPLTAHEWGRTGDDWVLVDLAVGAKLDKVKRMTESSGMTSNFQIREAIFGKPVNAKVAS